MKKKLLALLFSLVFCFLLAAFIAFVLARIGL